MAVRMYHVRGSYSICLDALISFGWLPLLGLSRCPGPTVVSFLAFLSLGPSFCLSFCLLFFSRCGWAPCSLEPAPGFCLSFPFLSFPFVLFRLSSMAIGLGIAL